jgi:hypothetical protein
MLHHTNQTNIQIFAKMKIFSDFQICNFPGYNRSMAILDNVDNENYPIFEWESKPIVEKDAMGRDIFWQE